MSKLSLATNPTWIISPCWNLDLFDIFLQCTVLWTLTDSITLAYLVWPNRAYGALLLFMGIYCYKYHGGRAAVKNPEGVWPNGHDYWRAHWFKKKKVLNKSKNCKCFLLKGTEVLKQPLSRRWKTYFDQFMKGIMTQLPTSGRSLIQWSKKFCLVFLFLLVHCSSNSKLVCVGFHSQIKVK